MSDDDKKTSPTLGERMAAAGAALGAALGARIDQTSQAMSAMPAIQRIHDGSARLGEAASDVGSKAVAEAGRGVTSGLAAAKSLTGGMVSKASGLAARLRGKDKDVAGE